MLPIVRHGFSSSFLQLAKAKRDEENISDMYQLEGSESLGSCLCIVPQVDSAPSISNYHIQWYRMLLGGNGELILGK